MIIEVQANIVSHLLKTTQPLPDQVSKNALGIFAGVPGIHKFTYALGCHPDIVNRRAEIRESRQIRCRVGLQLSSEDLEFTS